MSEVTLNTGAFGDGAARFGRAMNKTLRTWGFETERRAKMKSPVDTGFNANTIYTVTPDGKITSNGREVGTRPGLPAGPSRKHPHRRYSPGQFAMETPFDAAGGYQDQLATFGNGPATVVMMGGSQKIGPSTIAPAPDGMAVEVRVGSEYGIYLEVGTIHNRAQPFLGPAAGETTPMVDNMLTRNLKAEGLL
jgi:hypothetical protein